jgi:hydrogenase maturation protease
MDDARGTMNGLLIIGIGNPLRRDDGAGWELATRLAALLPGARQIRVQQLAPELAVDLAAPGVAAICFCDVRSDKTGLHLERVGETPEPPRMSHEISPETLLAYTGTVGTAPAAWLLTVGGADFDHGEGLSAETLAALEALPPAAAALATQLATL